MERDVFSKTELLQEVLDAIPALILVVDCDLRIFHLNSAASSRIGQSPQDVYLKRGGEVLRCIHSTEAPGGCGHSLACEDCILRNSAGEANRGTTVCRQKTRVTLRSDGTTRDLYLAVSAAPFLYRGETFVVLTLEDIGELVQLKSFLPICAGCKKVRSDAEYWESVERYFGTRVDVEFSHGICPDCKKRLYPQFCKDLGSPGPCPPHPQCSDRVGAWRARVPV